MVAWYRFRYSIVGLVLLLLDFRTRWAPSLSARPPRAVELGLRNIDRRRRRS